MSLEQEKEEWLRRYKSKQGRAIAKNGWEACEKAMKKQREEDRRKKALCRHEKLVERARAAGLV